MNLDIIQLHLDQFVTTWESWVTIFESIANVASQLFGTVGEGNGVDFSEGREETSSNLEALFSGSSSNA